MKAVVAAIFVAVSISACATTAPASPVSSPDIGRERMELVYSSIAAADFHSVTSRTLLLAALTAVRTQVTAVGGAFDAATPEFSDIADSVTNDFNAFVQTVEGIAAKNTRLSAENISEVAINAMVKATPDCLTQYQNPAPDMTAGLQSRLIAGNVGYVAWRNFTGSLNLDLRRALDGLLAQGAQGWLFDLRDTPGFGVPGEVTSWFLNGEPMWQKFDRRGGVPVPNYAKTESRLPAAYQLPVVVAVSNRTGGAAETFAFALRDNHRASLVGSRSLGCTGTAILTALPGGGQVIVATAHYGGVAGKRYANIGVDPDVAADAAALEVATKLLQTQITATAKP